VGLVIFIVPQTMVLASGGPVAETMGPLRFYLSARVAFDKKNFKKSPTTQ